MLTTGENEQRCKNTTYRSSMTPKNGNTENNTNTNPTKGSNPNPNSKDKILEKNTED